MLFDQDTIKQIQAIAFDAYKTTGRVAALLDGDTLRDYIGVAHSLGLSALVEAHTAEETEVAVNTVPTNMFSRKEPPWLKTSART